MRTCLECVHYELDDYDNPQCANLWWLFGEFAQMSDLAQAMAQADDCEDYEHKAE